MSSLQRSDEHLHYCDNSHRWIAPSEIEQELWEAELATHLERHRATLGRPLAAEAKCRTPRGGAGRLADTPARIIPTRPVSVGAARR